MGGASRPPHLPPGSRQVRRRKQPPLPRFASGATTGDPAAGTTRAEQLYERVFFEYGDDSVAQLGGVHLACEGASNVLTKVLEWGRLMAYLEQSTRYVPYDDRPGGRYRYHVPAELTGPLRERYVATVDRAFEVYRAWLPRVRAFYEARHPRDAGESESVYRMTIRAKALDTLRGLLPAATASNVGIYATGQAYEQLLLRMRAHPLAEVRAGADAMLVELRKVIPAFLRRVDLPDRGGAWSAYLADTQAATRVAADRVLATPEARAARSMHALASDDAEVTLTDFDPDGEVKVVAAALYAVTDRSDQELLAIARALTPEQRADVLRAYVGRRGNRRHKPGRALERTSYRFDVLADYGAFRDLQRHRLLTLEWQRLSPRHGWVMPDAVVEAGGAEDWRRVMDDSRRPARRDRGRRAARGRGVRGRHGVSRALLHGDERARGPARDRAPHRPPGPPVLPPGRPDDAPAHRRARRPPGSRRRHDVRRSLRGRAGTATGRAGRRAPPRRRLTVVAIRSLAGAGRPVDNWSPNQ